MQMSKSASCQRKSTALTNKKKKKKKRKSWAGWRGGLRTCTLRPGAKGKTKDRKAIDTLKKIQGCWPRLGFYCTTGESSEEKKNRLKTKPRLTLNAARKSGIFNKRNPEPLGAFYCRKREEVAGWG